ncbi:MAG: GTP-binding protein HflX [Ignavibacteria bacterium]|nr:MAG: GTP-binding protein HflX [Ignavibacteria bacterium]KAF0157607.1 MAG: GTP-binding protein HflX [Ignavibacteria bacterium]
MITLAPQPKERAILIALAFGEYNKEQVEEHLDELELLTDTAGAETVFKVMQERYRPDPAYYIGKGKAEEIAQLVELNNIQLIIFDDDLNATQVRNLEKLFERKVLDRSGLILDIFASHAKTREAKTQVELAQLQYTLPRLTRAWTHLSKQYGGIGTKGPGETQIETDRRIIRFRISKLKENLRKIESQHTTKSASRKDFLTATLVGYTNAGKSTLLNRLTNSEVLVENKLFATLDSTTRSFELSKGKTILLSDTVGFIRKLPHNLVASFKTTLNVVRDADIIIHVVDVTHDFYEDHIRVVEETLDELDAKKKTQIVVFNKVDDLKNRERLDLIKSNFPDSIIVSAERGININGLKSRLTEIYEKYFGEVEIEIPNSETRKIAKLYELADVTSIKYLDDKAVIKFRASSSNQQKIKRLLYETE